MPESASFLYDVRCATCKTKIAVSSSQKWGVFCDLFCAQDLPAVEQEMRDTVIEALSRDTDLSMARIASKFGLARQRIYQVMDMRDLRKEVKQ